MYTSFREASKSKNVVRGFKSRKNIMCKPPRSFKVEKRRKKLLRSFKVENIARSQVKETHPELLRDFKVKKYVARSFREASS